MDRSAMILYRALGALLGYPRAELREALPEIAAIVRDAPLLPPRDRDAVRGLIDLLAAADPLWAEERYVELFDRGRATSLYLFEHVHGEGRDRGGAMVELKTIYARAGLSLAGGELPDYLPAVLEYLSGCEPAEAHDMLLDCAHILRAIGEALLGRGSPYSALFAALLASIGEAGLDKRAAARRRVEPDDLDRDWFEEPAFAPQAATPAGPRGLR